jgi:hypothetical protein
MLALLGLINCPTQFKGRMGQVRTGEGKSTIVAMLAGVFSARLRIAKKIKKISNFSQIFLDTLFRHFFKKQPLTYPCE